MFENYYLQQLANLRTKATQFAEEHPAIAPLLMENSTDPDVERLLEGSAFLNAILHEKIDDDIPELIRGIVDILFPHFLRPLPSACIMAFTPKESLLDTIRVTSGTQLASQPIDGTKCLFKTTMNVDIAPLSVCNVLYEKLSSSEEVIAVAIRLNGITIEDLKPHSLTFYAGGDFIDASHFFMRLRTSLKRIDVLSGNHSFTLQQSSISTPGLDNDSMLLTSVNTQSSRYSLLTEYFMFPEKFLFFAINGLEQLTTNAGQNSDFVLRFIFTVKRDPLPCKESLFTLFATPAINLFPFEAEPVQIDHTVDKMPILPSCKNQKHYDIYTVDGVTGFVQGTVVRKTYMPYNKFRKTESKAGFFQIHQSKSIINNSREVKLSICYETLPQMLREVLSIDLTCTNAHLASMLKPGDISLPTSQSPELASFKNLTVPTEQVDVTLDNNVLWHFLSDFTVNLAPVTNVDSLRELLRKYTFYNQRSDSTVLNNLKRIDSIEHFSSEVTEQIINGIFIRGIKYKLTFNESNFSCTGDAYLFFTVLDIFLAYYTSINTFTQIEVYNSKSGERTEWKPRIGSKTLL